MSRILERAKEVFDLEIAGLEQVKNNLGQDFERMVKMLCEVLDRGGKIVFTGVGKSGYIGKKIAATMSSVGSPSIFMHPVEALHGDLGVMQKHDIVVALSYSGETDELLTTIKPAKRLGMKIISITASRTSSLGKLSDLVVEMPVSGEACPFNLAPTTTTTALLALGDALALVLLEVRGFTKEDYGRLHPGGAIGRMVTLRAADVMRKPDRWVLAEPTDLVKEILGRMGKARCGSAIIADADRKLLGIFTDGDFRRWAERDDKILCRSMFEVMTPNPIAIHRDALAVEILKLVEDKHISDIIIVDDENHVEGMIDVQDLPGLKLM